jgi:hypothetical protein
VLVWQKLNAKEIENFGRDPSKNDVIFLRYLVSDIVVTNEGAAMGVFYW